MTATTRRTTAETTAAATRHGTPVTGTRRARATRYLLAGIRLALGWVFLWAFLDKLFGLGLATETKNAWLDGGSPTTGFLAFGSAGPFQGFYQGIAGAAWADWLFMTGLAAIGTALVLGIGMRVAAAAGGLLLVMMWTAVLPPENNPFMDDHLVYAAVLAVLALVDAGDTWGLGRVWARLPIVQRTAGSGSHRHTPSAGVTTGDARRAGSRAGRFPAGWPGGPPVPAARVAGPPGIGGPLSGRIGGDRTSRPVRQETPE